MNTMAIQLCTERRGGARLLLCSLHHTAAAACTVAGRHSLPPPPPGRGGHSPRPASGHNLSFTGDYVNVLMPGGAAGLNIKSSEAVHAKKRSVHSSSSLAAPGAAPAWRATPPPRRSLTEGPDIFAIPSVAEQTHCQGLPHAH